MLNFSKIKTDDKIRLHRLKTLIVKAKYEEFFRMSYQHFIMATMISPSIIKCRKEIKQMPWEFLIKMASYFSACLHW